MHKSIHKLVVLNNTEVIALHTLYAKETCEKNKINLS